MLKLIKLEWKKQNIGVYIRNAVIMTLVLLVFIVLMTTELDADETMALYGKSMLNTAVELFAHMSYMIFTGAMIAAFIVSAYENKNINLMFSYPIKRQKILLSKVLAVWIFNFTALTLSKFLIYIILYVTKSYTHITAGGIRFGEASFYLEILLSSAAMVSISYIALFVGLLAKSSKGTIITTVIIVCFTQGNLGSFTLVGNLPFYAVLFILSIISVYLSVKNVETADVM